MLECNRCSLNSKPAFIKGGTLESTAEASTSDPVVITDKSDAETTYDQEQTADAEQKSGSFLDAQSTTFLSNKYMNILSSDIKAGRLASQLATFRVKSIEGGESDGNSLTNRQGLDDADTDRLSDRNQTFSSKSEALTMFHHINGKLNSNTNIDDDSNTFEGFGEATDLTHVFLQFMLLPVTLVEGHSILAIPFLPLVMISLIFCSAGGRYVQYSNTCHK